MYFKIIEINTFYKVVLSKTGFIVTFKIAYVSVEPDWLAKVELITDFVYGVKDFVCAGIVVIIAYDAVPKHTIVFKFFCPHTKHEKDLTFR